MPDHLGSTRALTDTSGNVVESVDYDSFGNGSSNLTRYGYTGREWDADANLYYYRNRWYDPQMGRFISADPIGLNGGINLYAYVGNNPTRYVDPSGLNPLEGALTLGELGFAVGGVPGAVIGASIGLVVGYIIWHADCDALTAGVDRLIAPYITSTTKDQTETKPRSVPIPYAPPMPDNPEGVVPLYHGTINDFTQIRANGLDPSRAPTWVTRDLSVARNAISINRYDVSQGLARDPGIVTSMVPRKLYDQHFAPFENPHGTYTGFGGGLASSEIILRTQIQFQIFNNFIVR